MRRPLISVLLGLLFAAGAIYFVYATRSPEPIQTPQAAEAAPTQSVLVAAIDIPFGTRLKPDFIRSIEWPAESVPANAVLNRDELLEGPEGERIVIRNFAAGEPFLKPKLSGFGEKPTLSRKVSNEMRAYTLRINDVSGVAGFLLPGDRVDILLTRQIGQSGTNLVTDVILQSISVLGIDQLASEQTENPVVGRTATVEVTPEQAQKLALAQQIGTLSLTLRNYTDAEATKVNRVSVSDLAESKPRARPRIDARPVVRIRKGTAVSTERVE